MRVLVIGGTACIGREIVRRLASRNHDVTVLHRRPHHDLGPGIHNVQADRSDLQAVSRAMREGRFDAVFDIAYDWQKGTTASHVEGAARGSGPGLHRYVFMSSIAAYGPGLDHRESDALVPDDVHGRTHSTRPAVALWRAGRPRLTIGVGLSGLALARAHHRTPVPGDSEDSRRAAPPAMIRSAVVTCSRGRRLRRLPG
jgi:uncharacterized protein YbjT (DUF2867 family)